MSRKKFLNTVKVLSKDDWTELLRATGLDEADMQKWHIEFERLSPEGHQNFLASLAIPAAEIQKIRTWAQKNQESDSFFDRETTEQFFLTILLMQPIRHTLKQFLSFENLFSF